MPHRKQATRADFSTRPLYMQIHDHFVELIASGEWESGKLLESENELARKLAVSVGTVRKALDVLEAGHLVSRRQGRGTTVNDQSSDEFNIHFSNLRIGDGQRVTGTISSVDVEEAEADANEQRQLKLKKGDTVFRCVRVREYHGRRFMFERLAITKKLLPDLDEAQFSIARVLAIAAKRNGILLGTGTEKVCVNTADPEVSKALSIAPGTPLLRLDRVINMMDGMPLEWRVADCHLQEKYYMTDFV